MEKQVGPRIPFVIEEGAVRQFALAAQMKDAWNYGPGSVIPPTFLMSAAMWFPPGSRVSSGFDRARLLHGGQEFVFGGDPPRVGDRLTAQDRLADRFEKTGTTGGRMRFAVVVTEFRRAESEEIIAESRATYIEREART